MLAGHRERLATLAERHRAAPLRRLDRLRQRQDLLATRLLQASRQSQGGARQRLEVLGARLQALDPGQVLARGYAWLGDELGRALVSVTQLQPGQSVTARLADGAADLRVEGVRRK